MELRIGATRLHIHPLMLMLPWLAALLGAGMEACTLLLSLCVHEAAHLACAWLLCVPVESLRVMPFGGSMALGNPYRLSPLRLFGIAAAGPAASLGLAVLSGALAQWNALGPEAALCMLRVNLALLTFNLFPALPLDGGRMLFALTERRLGRDRAFGLGLWLGRVLAVALLALAVVGWAKTGRLNLSPLFAAVFLVSSESSERRALTGAKLSTLADALSLGGEPVPAQLCAVSASDSLTSALGQARPGTVTLYLVYDGKRAPVLTDERQLIEAAIDDPTAPVRQAILANGNIVHLDKAS